MGRVKKKPPRSAPRPWADSTKWMIQVFLGVLAFLSIYFQSLMGPFGEWVQRIGVMVMGDSVMLLPWILIITAPILKYGHRGWHYVGYLSAFIVFFGILIDSFLDQKTHPFHHQITTTIPHIIIHYGARVFGEFGIRFFVGTITLLIGGILLAPVFASSTRPSKKTVAASRPRFAWVTPLKYYLFYKKKSRASTLASPLPDIPSPARRDILKNIAQPPTPVVVITPDSPPIPDDPPPPLPPDPSLIPDDVVPLNDDTEYVCPPIDLLHAPRQVDARQIESDMQNKAKILEMTLDSFKVSATVMNVTIGPSVSRFELQPGNGVKISKITSLSQDIALKLAVPTVRIEAPIPGKALVGIEVPNADIAPLNLRTIFQTHANHLDAHPLTCILGQRITGEGVTMNLAKMPHVLVAGSTGSGKSVCVNAIILSILLKATPDEVKFLMIDPKKVELSLYADIPHLLAPVVTNPNKAAATLKQWALAEMERRYELFTDHGVKDLTGFNALANDTANELSPIPYIVVIIDEFADLMMVASQDVENAICRLAQMARATGIHLVLATQRPSVNVVTGLIKANIPSRISFAVQSQIDSRTVLDMPGAEKLLGRGDMLYMPVGASKPERVQGVFVPEDEVNAVVTFIKNQSRPDYLDEIMDVEPIQSKPSSTQESSNPQRDALFDEANALIQQTQYASISYLQRKLRIGYNRAARLMDELVEANVVSAYDRDNKGHTVLPQHDTPPLA